MLTITQEMIDTKYTSTEVYTDSYGEKNISYTTNFNDIKEPFELAEGLKIPDSFGLNLNTPFITKLPSSIYFEPKGEGPEHIVMNLKGSGIHFFPMDFNPHNSEIEIYTNSGQLSFVPNHLQNKVFETTIMQSEDNPKEVLEVDIPVPTEDEWFKQQPLPYCDDLVQSPEILDMYRGFVLTNAYTVQIAQDSESMLTTFSQEENPRYLEKDLLHLMNDLTVTDVDLYTRLLFELQNPRYNVEHLKIFDDLPINAHFTRIELMSNEYLAVNFSKNENRLEPIFYNANVKVLNDRTALDLCMANAEIIKETLEEKLRDKILDTKLALLDLAKDDKLLKEQLDDRYLDVDTLTNLMDESFNEIEFDPENVDDVIKAIYNNEYYEKIEKTCVSAVQNKFRESLIYEISYVMQRDIEYDGYSLTVANEDDLFEMINFIADDFKITNQEIIDSLDMGDTYARIFSPLKERLIEELNLEYEFEDGFAEGFDFELNCSELVEKFSEQFKEDDIAQKLREAFKNEVKNNYHELYEKMASDNLNEEEVKFLKEIMFGASIQVEEELQTELNQQPSPKPRKQK